MNFITIVSCIARILGCLFAAGCIALIPKVRTWLATKLSNEQMIQLELVIKQFVEAADQQFKTDDPDGTNRKAYVEKQLAEMGIILDEQINSMIESAVYELKNNK